MNVVCGELIKRKYRYKSSSWSYTQIVLLQNKLIAFFFLPFFDWLIFMMDLIAEGLYCFIRFCIVSSLFRRSPPLIFSSAALASSPSTLFSPFLLRPLNNAEETATDNADAAAAEAIRLLSPPFTCVYRWQVTGGNLNFT